MHFGAIKAERVKVRIKARATKVSATRFRLYYGKNKYSAISVGGIETAINTGGK